ncbi:MAG: MFS transporter [Hyphomicrobiaceae bacterium]|nr:MFS transporter [Hyphomicrobiaceae bacterium]
MDDNRRHYGGWVAGYFGALFLIHGIHLPFLPVWLAGRGLDASAIAVVTAAPFLLRLVVSPAVALMADRSGRHRDGIVALSCLAAVLAILLPAANGFAAILLVCVALTLATTSIMPLIEVVATAGVRAHGLVYGHMRLWGSLSFIVASLIAAAALDVLGSEVIAPLMAGAALVTALVATRLPHPPGPAPGVGPTAQAAPRWRDVAGLIGTPAFAALLVASGSVQAAHATYYTYSALHWSAQGHDGIVIGALWTLGILAEIALFAVAGRVVGRLGPVALLAIAGVAAVVRWTAMAFDPPLGVLAGLQLLHAATFAAAHLGAIGFIAEAVPQRLAGTAQALHATVGMGVAMGAATLVAGQLYASFAAGAYFGMAALAVVALIATAFLARCWQRGHGLSGQAGTV